MGSNSFRLEIGQVGRDRYKRIDYLKETVRLGAGLDAQGMLSEEAMQRGLACLGRFAERLTGYALSQVRAVATQTLREAQNRDAFLARAQAVLGRPIEVISGREEARLIYSGVARLQPSTEKRLVIDIGGRSTELILGQGSEPLQVESFQVGSVSLSMRYFGDGRFTESAFRDAQIAAGAELEEGLDTFAARHWREALGSSGTAGAVSQMLAASAVTDGTITPAGLQWCIEQCLRAGHIDRLQLPGLKSDRRAVIGGGLSILCTLAAHFHIHALHPARGALRQGVIFDLAQRADEHGDHDVRERTITELQRRFEADLPQAQRVHSAARALHDGIFPNAEAAQLRALRWACALHEIGRTVSHHDHHRHSAYLIMHADAAGFSQSLQQQLAQLVLAQRGGLRKVEAQLADDAFAWQALCLRLAVIQCHARGETMDGVIRLSRQGSQARLSFSETWAAAHPRVLHLLNEEVQAWARVNALSLQLRTDAA